MGVTLLQSHIVNWVPPCGATVYSLLHHYSFLQTTQYHYSFISSTSCVLLQFAVSLQFPPLLCQHCGVQHCLQHCFLFWDWIRDLWYGCSCCLWGIVYAWCECTMVLLAVGRCMQCCVGLCQFCCLTGFFRLRLFACIRLLWTLWSASPSDFT